MTRNWRTILIFISLSALVAIAISPSMAIEAGEVGQEVSANTAATSTALSWTTSATPLPKVLNEHGAAVWDDRIYVTGGNSGSYATNSSDVYFSEVSADGTLSAWTPTTSLPGVQNSNELVAVNNTLYLIGEGTSTTNVKRASILSDGSLGSQWTAAAGGYMSHGRIRTAAVTHGDDIYVLGGWTGSSPLDKVARARTNPDGSYVSPGWQGERPLPHALHAHAAAVLNGYLYVLGGVRDLSTDVRADVIAAEIMTDGSLGPWNTVTSLPIPIYSMEAVAYQGKLYVVGGSVAIDSHLDTVYAATPLYDGSGGLSDWRAMESLPVARTGHKVVATPSAVFSLGGHTTDSIFVAVSSVSVNGTTTRVSVSSTGVEGDDHSDYPSISADGRYVAFRSVASNLVAEDSNNDADVFVHDQQTSNTTRVSIDSNGTEGNGWSDYPSISRNGRYVAFHSQASNLVAMDSNNTNDVFVHDQQTGSTIRVSVASDGSEGDLESSFPAISADSRYVAFRSRASNLVISDTNGFADIFVHDRQTGNTTRVSVDSDGAEGNGQSSSPAISADGRYIVFMSFASNLVAGDTNGYADIFVHDRQTGTTSRVSVDSAGSEGNDWSSEPAISDDGRYVAFESKASNLVPGDLYDDSDIFVHDRLTGNTNRASVDSAGMEQGGDSHGAAISADGRFVSFTSEADLVLGAWLWNCFVHDQQTGSTTEVSFSSHGIDGNDHSGCGAISADGRYVAFTSLASNLVAADTNGASDIFVHDRGSVVGTPSISGVVRNSSGAPLAGIVVQGGAAGTVLTNEAGYYSFTDLVPGVYTITPNDEDYAFSPPKRTVSTLSQVSTLNSRATTTASEDFQAQNLECPAVRFLDLPINYDGTQQGFALAVKDTDDDKEYGRIDSWFDHTTPLYQKYTGGVMTYDGELRDDPDSYYGIGCYEQRCYDGHNGLDIDTNLGDSVRPAGDGVVVDLCGSYKSDSCKEKRHAYWGNYVVVQHEGGYLTAYGHLDSVSTSIGAVVTRGTKLGEVGSTGPELTGEHLHFSVACDRNSDSAINIYNELLDPFGFKGEKDPYQVYGYDYDKQHWNGPPSNYLWIHDQDTTASAQNGAASTVTDATGTVSVGISEDDVEGQIAIELAPSPAAGAYAQLKSIGRSIWMRLLEWLPGGSSTNTRLLAGVEGEFTFVNPVSMTMTYDPASVKHFKEGELRGMIWDEAVDEWLPIPSTVDQANKTVAFETLQMGIFDVQGPLLCDSDSYEVDDQADQAVWLTVSQTPMSRGFDLADDTDWHQLPVQEGTSVTFNTQNLANGIDTVISLYDTDGHTLLASNDDAGVDGSSSLTWTAPANGVYYLEVVNKNGLNAGCDATYELVMQATATQTLELTSGWNMISSYVQPDDLSFDALFPVEMRDQLVLCKDDQGRIYWPEYGIASLENWAADDGYQCYTTGALTITLTGTPVTWETAQTFAQGWNTAAYWENEPRLVESVFSPIDELVLAKSVNGDVYWPEYGIDNIGEMQPGQGYKLYLSAPATLVYPAD